MPGSSTDDLRLARNIGWFSLSAGLLDAFLPGQVRHLTGVKNRPLISLVGVRELITGAGLLYTNRPAPWLWARVAGDVMDLAALKTASVTGDRRSDREQAAYALAMIAGVTLVDLCAAFQYSRGSGSSMGTSTTGTPSSHAADVPVTEEMLEHARNVSREPVSKTTHGEQSPLRDFTGEGEQED